MFIQPNPFITVVMSMQKLAQFLPHIADAWDIANARIAR
jgi:hypothetical protein